MVKDRHPSIAELIVSALEGGLDVRSIQAVMQCTQVLERTGFDCPPWAHLAEERTAGVAEEKEDPCQPHTGWQQQAASSIERHHLKNAVWPVLREHERAMMRSQCGPLASSPFVSFPTSRLSRIDSAPFRVLLLRRLRLPLPFSVRSCRCGRPFDALGHHRAACATAGVLGRRGWALESAAARVCTEGGARVRLNVFVRDMDLTEPNRLDGRRLEVVADGLPLHGGAQLAIDTTMVSPLQRDGTARRGTLLTRTGKPWRWRGDGKNEPIRSSPVRAVEPDWSFLVHRCAGDGPQRQHNSCRLCRRRRCESCQRNSRAMLGEHGLGGTWCSDAQPRGQLRCLSSTLFLEGLTGLLIGPRRCSGRALCSSVTVCACDSFVSLTSCPRFIEKKRIGCRKSHSKVKTNDEFDHAKQ